MPDYVQNNLARRKKDLNELFMQKKLLSFINNMEYRIYNDDCWIRT